MTADDILLQLVLDFQRLAREHRAKGRSHEKWVGMAYAYEAAAAKVRVARAKCAPASLPLHRAE
jgi:hypothetical protein